MSASAPKGQTTLPASAAPSTQSNAGTNLLPVGLPCSQIFSIHRQFRDDDLFYLQPGMNPRSCPSSSLTWGCHRIFSLLVALIRYARDPQVAVVRSSPASLCPSDTLACAFHVARGDEHVVKPTSMYLSRHDSNSGILRSNSSTSHRY